MKLNEIFVILSYTFHDFVVAPSVEPKWNINGSMQKNLFRCENCSFYKKGYYVKATKWHFLLFLHISSDLLLKVSKMRVLWNSLFKTLNMKQRKFLMEFNLFPQLPSIEHIFHLHYLLLSWYKLLMYVLSST